jgi:hypothetical protein
MKEEKHIYINNDWSISWDGYCWHLSAWTDGKPNKDGETKRVVKTTTYHSSIEKLSKYVLDMECGMQDTFEKILHTLGISSKILARSIDIILEEKERGKKRA